MLFNLNRINFHDKRIRKGYNRLRILVSIVAWIGVVIFMATATTRTSRPRSGTAWNGGTSRVYYSTNKYDEFETLVSATLTAVGIYLFMLGLYWGTHWIIQGFRYVPKINKPTNETPREIEYVLHITDHSSFRPRMLHMASFLANTRNDHEQAKSYIIFNELEPIIPVGQWTNQWRPSETGLISWHGDLCVELHTDLPETEPTTTPPTPSISMPQNTN